MKINLNWRHVRATALGMLLALLLGACSLLAGAQPIEESASAEGLRFIEFFSPL